MSADVLDHRRPTAAPLAVPPASSRLARPASGATTRQRRSMTCAQQGCVQQQSRQ